MKKNYTIKLENYSLSEILDFENEAIIFTQTQKQPDVSLELINIVKEAFYQNIINDIEYVEWLHYFIGVGYDENGNAIDEFGEIIEISNNGKAVFEKLQKHTANTNYGKYFIKII